MRKLAGEVAQIPRRVRKPAGEVAQIPRRARKPAGEVAQIPCRVRKQVSEAARTQLVIRELALALEPQKRRFRPVRGRPRELSLARVFVAAHRLLPNVT